jgi:hypothetical protein
VPESLVVYWLRERNPFNASCGATQMLMLTKRPAPSHARGRESAAQRLAYRRLAAAILGLDVPSMAVQLQVQRTGLVPEPTFAQLEEEVLA